jgi:hypothetical protein
MNRESWQESVKERNQLKELGIDERIVLKCVLKQYGGRAWIGLI